MVHYTALAEDIVAIRMGNIRLDYNHPITDNSKLALARIVLQKTQHTMSKDDIRVILITASERNDKLRDWLKTTSRETIRQTLAAQYTYSHG